MLVKDIGKIRESAAFEEAGQGDKSRFVLDRANIEDILLYVVKSEEKR